jgi:hypothetical protein
MKEQKRWFRPAAPDRLYRQAGCKKCVPPYGDVSTVLSFSDFEANPVKRHRLHLVNGQGLHPPRAKCNDLDLRVVLLILDGTIFAR